MHSYAYRIPIALCLAGPWKFTPHSASLVSSFVPLPDSIGFTCGGLGSYEDAFGIHHPCWRNLPGLL